MTESLYERMDKLHGEIAQLVEDMGETVYSAIENETLKDVAKAANVDWTQEGTKMLEEIGWALQRERDVNRELRRTIKARDGLIARLTSANYIPWQELKVGDRFRLSSLHHTEVVVAVEGNMLGTDRGVTYMPPECRVERCS